MTIEHASHAHYEPGSLSRPPGESLYSKVVRAINNASKLRVLLAQIKYRQDAGIPLTVMQEELLAECQRRYYAKPTKRVRLDKATGRITVTRQVDADPLLSAIRDYADTVGKQTGAAGGRMFAAVDAMSVERMLKDSGLRLGTAEFNAYVKKQVTSGEYTKYKVNYNGHN